MKRPSEEAQRLKSHRAKKEAVPTTPGEHVQRPKQQIVSLFGTIDYDDAYDYKQERRRPTDRKLHAPRER